MRLINGVRGCEEEAVLNEYVNLRLEETEWRGALHPAAIVSPCEHGFDGERSAQARQVLLSRRDRVGDESGRVGGGFYRTAGN